MEGLALSSICGFGNVIPKLRFAAKLFPDGCQEWVSTALWPSSEVTALSILKFTHLFRLLLMTG